MGAWLNGMSDTVSDDADLFSGAGLYQNPKRFLIHNCVLAGRPTN